ncbi:MAG TPA: extracellular solute-binding protein [Mycobacteriales bacterium]|nr:extracellular solute-binding protein [Mycobacteriales bacterium]
MRRRSAVIAAVVIAGMLAACGRGATITNPRVGRISGPAADSVVPWAASGKASEATVTVCYFSGPEFDSIQHFAPEFTQLTRGRIKVRLVSIPITQALPATIHLIRTSSACDLVDAGSINAADLDPYLVPLEPMMHDPGLFNAKVYDLADFPAGVRDVASMPGRGLMSFTLGADVQMLFYRKDLLAHWGIRVPEFPATWTWPQFEDVLRRIKAQITAEHRSMSPISVSGTQDNNGSMFAMTAMWAFGGDPFRNDAPHFTDSGSIAGLSHWTGLLTQEKVASPGSPTFAYNELLTALQQEKTVMAIEWNAAASTLADPKQSPKTAGRIGYATLPYSDRVDPATPRVFPTTHTLGISAHSKHQRQAFEFAAWYTSPETARRMVAEGRGSSGRQSVLTDPGIVAKQPSLAAVAASTKLYHRLPSIPSFGELLANVIASPVNAAFTGQQSPPEAARSIQRGAENLEQKAGK